jgi:hypothetical protein
MKKNNLTLIIVLLAGLIVGTILAELVSGVPALQFLAKSAEIRWEPKADLQVLQYDVRIAVKLNLASVLGLAGAFWLYRKM